MNLRIEDISKVTRSVLEMLNIEPFNPKNEGMPVEFMDHGDPGEEKPTFCLPEDYPSDIDCGKLVRAAVEQALTEMTIAAENRVATDLAFKTKAASALLIDLVTLMQENAIKGTNVLAHTSLQIEDNLIGISQVGIMVMQVLNARPTATPQGFNTVLTWLRDGCPRLT